NQLGFNPSWRWITLHAGDFSDDYTDLTVQGTRVRGAGFDLTPGRLRFSFQGGQSQRAVFAGDGTSVYARNLLAGTVGYGNPDGSFLNLTIVKAKDDPNSIRQAVIDTTLISDTIPVPLRPQEQTRPQENLVMGIGGQVALLGHHLVVKGEGDGAVVTHDLDSPLANASDVRFGTLVSHFMPLRLSSSGDYAYKLDGTYGFGAGARRLSVHRSGLHVPWLVLPDQRPPRVHVRRQRRVAPEPDAPAGTMAAPERQPPGTEGRDDQPGRRDAERRTSPRRQSLGGGHGDGQRGGERRVDRYVRRQRPLLRAHHQPRPPGIPARQAHD